MDQEASYSEGRLTDEEGSDQTSDDEDNGPALERTETFVGTQNYLSPEMITGKS